MSLISDLRVCDYYKDAPLQSINCVICCINSALHTFGRHGKVVIELRLANNINKI